MTRSACALLGVALALGAQARPVLDRGTLEIGIGAQFRLGHRLGLFIEPSYQHALSPGAKHPSFDKLPFNPHIHSFNLATGLSFQFH